jgi:hypothetical protein
LQCIIHDKSISYDFKTRSNLAVAEAKLDPDGTSGLTPSAAQGKEAELLAYLTSACSVRVQSVCVQSDEGNKGICFAVALADDEMKAVLDGFRLRYHLMM